MKWIMLKRQKKQQNFIKIIEYISIIVEKETRFKY